MNIHCSFETQFNGQYVLFLTSVTDALRQLKLGNDSEYKTVAMASDGGRYECSAQVKNVVKSDYANLTVRGEGPAQEQRC